VSVPAEDRIPLSADTILQRLDAHHAVKRHQADPDPATEPWEPPIPLSGHRNLPRFPVDVLPGWVADQVAAVAEFTQTPPDLAGCVALAALSTAAGGKVEVVVRGSWREPVNIFTVVALPPGARKSPVFTAMTEPLLLAERVLGERIRPQIVEAELAASTARGIADRAAAAAAKADPAGRAQAVAEASDAAMAAEMIEVPVMPTLVADDVTAEPRLGCLPSRVGVSRCCRMRVAYSPPWPGATRVCPTWRCFLKDTLGRCCGSTGVAVHPSSSTSPRLPSAWQCSRRFCAKSPTCRAFVAAGCSPASSTRFRRTLLVAGGSAHGTEPVPEAVAAAYTRNMQALVISLADLRERVPLPLTDPAGEAVLALEADVDPKLAPTAAWAHVVDWGSKYVGAVIRLAGLLHLAQYLRDGWHQPINADTLERAAALGRYFADHALAAFDAMGADPLLEDARLVLDHLRRHKPERVTKRDLFTGLPRSRFKKATDLDPVLNLLEQHGYLRRLPDPPRTGPGRPPSMAYLVYPNLGTSGTFAFRRPVRERSTSIGQRLSPTATGQTTAASGTSMDSSIAGQGRGGQPSAHQRSQNCATATSSPSAPTPKEGPSIGCVSASSIPPPTNGSGPRPV